MSSTMHDIGAYLVAQYALGSTTQVAGAETEVDGVAVDRTGFQCAKVIVPIQATLDTSATVSVAIQVQHSTQTGAGFTDYSYDSTGGTSGGVLASTVIATAAAPGEETGVASLDVDLATANQYVRVQVTPDLSRAGTDTCTFNAVWLFGGDDTNPAA